MNELIYINEKKCTLCYSCVRICPVKAIEVKHNQEYASIIPNRCIGCGSCTGVCPEDAISFYDSREETITLLHSGAETVAIVAPSISGEFNDITDYRKFVQMIKQLGFKYVNEVSFGVDLVAKQYAELFKNFKGKYYITSLCPVVVSFVEKYYPELIDNLVPIISPMIATALVVKKCYGENTKIVYIGPCLENKKEVLRYKDEKGEQLIHSVLTFVELRQLFEEFDINESKLEFSEFDEPLGYKGSLFPISNGILQSVKIYEDLLEGEIITTEGRNNIIEALKAFDKSLELIRKHFNLFYCEGCIMGPGTSKGGEKFTRRTLVIDYAKKRLKNFNAQNWEQNIKKYDKIDFTAHFIASDQRIKDFAEDKVTEILKVIGRNAGSNSLGCKACGYDSCREFAIAVANGFAKTDMCLSYNLKNKQEYIKTLRVTNEKLAETQAALKESEQKARIEQQLAKDAKETASAMLQKLHAGVVIVDEKLKIIESNNSFINLLGEDAKMINEVIPGLIGADLKTLVPYQIYNLFSYVLKTAEDIQNKDIHYEQGILNISIFTIRKNKVVGAIIRDMSSPEVMSEEMISRVAEVIDENLSVVQQIGFLLGEGAAKTEKMLNSIIESYKASKK